MTAVLGQNGTVVDETQAWHVKCKCSGVSHHLLLALREASSDKKRVIELLSSFDVHKRSLLLRLRLLLQVL